MYPVELQFPMDMKSNPGLAPYDLSSYRGIRGKNFYKMDGCLGRVVRKNLRTLPIDEQEAIENHLSGYGNLVGGILSELTEKCHKEGKYGEIQKYNSVGDRIDEVVYSPEQLESRRVSYEYGIVNLDFHSGWKFPFHSFHKYALAYLIGLNGEGGVACPLAMTDGMILALKKIGTEEQKNKFLPLVAGEGSSSHFFAGQYVTERVGGSNVGANRTVARKAENGKWILNGEKWFCSNPGDLWVTTARIENSSTIGMFLVHRWREDGTLNGHHLLRKKDIIGSRGKVTAEIIYEELEAEELGRPSHGLSNLIKYIISISRIHVGIGSTAGARRAFWEAREYSRHRKAYGKNLQQFPIYENNLCELQVRLIALTLCNFRSISYYESENPAHFITVPLMKYKSSSEATLICHNAILSMGGNGIIGDFSPLPRLLNDSIINESWEGTHFLLSEHILKALERPKYWNAFWDGIVNLETVEFTLSENIKSIITKKKNKLLELFKTDRETKELYRMKIADLVYQLFSLSVLLQEVEYEREHNPGESLFIDILDIYSSIIDETSEYHKSSPILDPIKRSRIVDF